MFMMCVRKKMRLLKPMASEELVNKFADANTDRIYGYFSKSRFFCGVYMFNFDIWNCNMSHIGFYSKSIYINGSPLYVS